MSKLLSIAVAIGLSFFMFLGMTLMIEPEVILVDSEPKPTVIIDYKEKDDEPDRITRIKPVLDLVQPPKIIATAIEAPKATKDRPRFIQVAFQGEGLKAGDKLASLWNGAGNGDAMPKVQINPRYPPVAARDNIEGYVTLSFDVTAIGTTENIRVVDAKPRGVFEKSARKALAKWKYQPKMKDNKAMGQPNQQITLQFNLEKEYL